MKKNTIEDYQAAIKAKYEEVKITDTTGFLHNPTPGGLRDLCLELHTGSNNIDKEIYERFFSLRDGNTYKQIESFDISRFKPLCSFLKGTTLTKLPKNLNLLAVLVDFEPRPFLKFSNGEKHILKSVPYIYNIDSLNTIVSEPTIVEYKNEKIETETAENEVVENSPEVNSKEVIEDEVIEDLSEEQNTTTSETADTTRSSFYTAAENKHYNFTLKANRIKLVSLVLLVFVAIAFIAKNMFFSDEGCMIWKDDHYEATPCETQIKNFVAIPVVHLDKETLALQKKIKPCDTTTFFVNGKPVVWYCKMQNGTVEYFSYPGLHPVTGITLKHITQGIISKYVLDKK